MAATARPRRSVLYMPGSNVRALEKARTLAADGLILDLEDAVSPDAKVEARATVVAAAGNYGQREVLIRVNGLATPWGQADVVSAGDSAADGILVPKVQSADMVRQVEAIMEVNNAPAAMKIWCMIETPLGVLHVEEIASSTPRLGGFVMGTSDLAKDMRCLHTSMRLPFLSAFTLCVMAARAYGLSIIDGVFLDLGNDQGFEASCIQGRELGFDGKTLIHPKTIAAANAAFGPTKKDVEWSKTIIEAHAAAEKKGKGVVVIDGKLIENLHVATAKRLVAEAEAIAALEAGLAAISA